jgi:hypothetical protein
MSRSGNPNQMVTLCKSRSRTPRSAIQRHSSPSAQPSLALGGGRFHRDRTRIVVRTPEESVLRFLLFGCAAVALLLGSFSLVGQGLGLWEPLPVPAARDDRGTPHRTAASDASQRSGSAHATEARQAPTPPIEPRAAFLIAAAACAAAFVVSWTRRVARSIRNRSWAWGDGSARWTARSSHRRRSRLAALQRYANTAGREPAAETESRSSPAGLGGAVSAAQAVATTRTATSGALAHGVASGLPARWRATSARQRRELLNLRITGADVTLFLVAALASIAVGCLVVLGLR